MRTNDVQRRTSVGRLLYGTAIDNLRLFAIAQRRQLFFIIADDDLDSPIGLSAFGRVIGGHGPYLAKASHPGHPVRRQGGAKVQSHVRTRYLYLSPGVSAKLEMAAASESNVSNTVISLVMTSN